jgi:hypothetical protein
LPGDLGDVLRYYLPIPGEDAAERSDGERARAVDAAPERPAALPIVLLPIDERDVVRAAFAWNLTVEMARLGASASLLAPLETRTRSIWPEEGSGPVGAEAAFPSVGELGDLTRAALDVAVNRAADSRDGGVVVVCAPRRWLRESRDGHSLLRWVLLLSTTDTRDLLATYALVKQLLVSNENTRVGITIHGARRVAEAKHAFNHVASVTAKHLGRTPVSYGLLVDDLHVYRAIVARRPIGLEHPQSRAARALRDVAGLILDDARGEVAHD